MPKNEALAIMPAGDAPLVTPEQMELVKRTVAKDATPDELKLYFFDCQRQGVHPLDKLIHFTKRSGKYTPITSIDFMRTRASDSGDYAGNDDAVFQVNEDGKHPDSASVTVYRLVQGQRCAFTATARWSEYLPEQAFMWKKMPFTMLGKCAEALALRKAFPRQLSGLYAAEEMAQSGRKPPEELGEAHEAGSEEDVKVIRLGGIIESETEKQDKEGTWWIWYKVKTLNNDGPTTILVRSRKDTDTGRLAERVGYLVDIEVVLPENAKPEGGLFTLWKVLEVRKPAASSTGVQEKERPSGKPLVGEVLEQPKTSPKKQTAPKSPPDAKEGHSTDPSSALPVATEGQQPKAATSAGQGQTDSAREGWLVTDPQRKRLFALKSECKFTDSQLRNLAGNFGVEHLHEMTPKQYKEITEEMELYIRGPVETAT